MGTPQAGARRVPIAVLVLVVSGALLRVVLAFLPLRWQLAHILSDDTFYYLSIARHLARSGMPSFDGLNPTNGFHPLWVGVLTPFFALPLSDEAGVRIAVLLCGVIDTMSLLLLLHILRTLQCGTAARVAAAGLYACMPALLSHAGPLNGMDTSLSMLLLFSVLAAFIALQRKRAGWYASRTAFGVLTGLALLARTDSIAILVPLWFGYALKDFPGRLPGTVRAAGAAMLVVSPWLIWNVLTFGTMMQVSGEAYAFSMNDLLRMADWGAVDYAKHFAENLADVFRFFPVALASGTKWSWTYGVQITLLLTLAIPAWCTARAGDTHRQRGLRLRMSLLAAPLAGCALFIAVHTLRTGTLRGWYYASVLPPLFVLLACVCDALYRQLHSARARIAPIITMSVAVVLIAVSSVGLLLREGGELPKADALPALREIVPPGAVIASWNAGVYGYFLSDRTVINLDGLVNNAVYPHMRSRSVGQYCRLAGVSYLVDMSGAYGLWDRSWSPEPGVLRKSIVILRTVRRAETDSAVVIAALRQQSSAEP
jgi:hypothetical protein